MQESEYNILVWLPSPMGDGILCTPALRAIRRHFNSSRITFFANSVVREILSPCSFNDAWIEERSNCPIALARELRAHRFTHAILFKNSVGSALAVRLARIRSRTGYAREWRGFLLTEKLHPPRLADGKFKPRSMLDYYLDIASGLGAETTERGLELRVHPDDASSVKAKLPEPAESKGPVVVMVPGGAYGPSKCWPSASFAETADRLIANHNATVVISVAPDPVEKRIADEICAMSNHKLINLATSPVGLGELKALFAACDLVITNDTGPRHIAIALGRKVVTLLGPNNPAWTETDYEDEIQIFGNVLCAPCTKPKCTKREHLCMESITVEIVCSACDELLAGRRTRARVFVRPQLEETSESFFVNPEYRTALGKLGLTSVEEVFSFDKAKALTKSNLARFRSRMQFEITSAEHDSPVTVFLKRYDRPPILAQLRNRLSGHGRKGFAACEYEPTSELQALGVNTPEVVCYGEQWGAFFEERSFIITAKIPDAEALERKLPEYFEGEATAETLSQRRSFIKNLATFIRKFHETGYRHRDLYFSHIFWDSSGTFYLIDLARAFRPVFLGRRFLLKDIAQVHYSAPAAHFTQADRLRFYLAYTGRSSLTTKDKAFIRKVAVRAERMARHDKTHGRSAPFAR